MATGIEVGTDCASKFLELKLHKKYRYILFKIDYDAGRIVVDAAVEKSTYEEFLMSLPPQKCRYGIYDFEYQESSDSAVCRNRLLFLHWCPDNASPKSKMTYAASKNEFKNRLEGISYDIQATDLSEASYNAVVSKMEKRPVTDL